MFQINGNNVTELAQGGIAFTAGGISWHMDATNLCRRAIRVCIQNINLVLAALAPIQVRAGLDQHRSQLSATYYSYAHLVSSLCEKSRVLYTTSLMTPDPGAGALCWQDSQNFRF